MLHGAGSGGLAPREAAQALAEGSLLGLYRFDQLKGRRPPPGPSRAPRPRGPARETRGTDNARRAVQRITVVEQDEARLPEIEEGLRRGRILAESTSFARDLVTRPGNDLTPRTLATAAEEMAGRAGLRCQVLGPEEMAELKMGALLGVAQGSEEPARFIIVEHRPEGAEGPPVVLCGKGITFDTGGISIKPGDGMWAMKDDMAGGAAVLGALRALALLDVPRPAVALVAGGGEHAQRERHPARGRPAGDGRADDRDHQHGRRGAPRPGRRPGLRPALLPPGACWTWPP